MLPAAHRLTDPVSFREAVRHGRRASSPTMVTHLLTPVEAVEADRAAQVGFVVSKAVGNSVVRSRVQRRLRHLLRPELVRLAAGDVLVVRALAPAAGASSDQLGRDLARCLTRTGLSDRRVPA